MEDRQARAYRIVDTNLHPHHSLFFGNPSHLCHRGTQLLVGGFEQPVDAGKAPAQGSLLAHIERHDLLAASSAQHRLITHEKACGRRRGLDKQAIGRRLAGKGFKTLPEPCGIGKVCPEAERSEASAHGIIHEENLALRINPHHALRQGIKGIDD